MVGNYSDPRFNIGYTEAVDWFAWRPVKTNNGWRWLVTVVKITEVIRSDFFLWKLFSFFGLDLGIGKDSITYETKMK